MKKVTLCVLTGFLVLLVCWVSGGHVARLPSVRADEELEYLVYAPIVLKPFATPTPGLAGVRILEVYNYSTIEYVRLANQGTAAQDMGGWSVSGSKGDERYVFPGGYVLAAGAGVRLHSGTGGVDAPPADIYWTTKNVWNNDGETVYLWNAQSAQVDSYSY